jgi:2-polyprenyl-6-methoxyphenol hydroxylase-like FAD-dependent oxidoreductase
MARRLSGDIAIVGGSLAGLATGIGLARAGISVRIYEQSVGEERGGTGLGVDRALISATTGVDARKDGVIRALPVVNEGYRETSTWLAIYRWLRALAGVTDGLIITESARIEHVHCDHARAYLEGPAGHTSASIVLGADGYRSVVRCTVSPEHPFAPYSGFLLWRGLVDESCVSKRLVGKLSLGGERTICADATRLVIYRVPGRNGETAPGARAINFAWYDASRTSWLHDRGFLVDGEVTGSVPNSAIDDELRRELLKLAKQRWSGAASEILSIAIEQNVVFGTPLAEYLPEQMSRGRIALVGDAAHVASPMLGAGFVSGLLDGAAIIRAIEQYGGAAADSGSRALERYDKERLGPNRNHVLESLAQTRDLLHSVAQSPYSLA